MGGGGVLRARLKEGKWGEFSQERQHQKELSEQTTHSRQLWAVRFRSIKSAVRVRIGVVQQQAFQRSVLFLLSVSIDHVFRCPRITHAAIITHQSTYSTKTRMMVLSLKRPPKKPNQTTSDLTHAYTSTFSCEHGLDTWEFNQLINQSIHERFVKKLTKVWLVARKKVIILPPKKHSTK